LLFLLTYGTSVYLAAPHGIDVVATVAVAVNAAFLLACVWLLLRPLGLSVREQFQDVRGPLVSLSPLVVAAIAVDYVLDDLGAPRPLTLAAAALVGIAIYMLCLRRTAKATWADLRAFVLGSGVFALSARRRSWEAEFA